MQKKLISYIFPIYNEEDNINKLYDVLLPELKKIEDKYDFEIICVNDGSKDNSLQLLIDLHEKDNRFKIVNFSRNFGQQMAVTAGMDFTKGDAVIIMDADLQDPPRVSLELIQKWEEGYEVVYAQRRTRVDSPFKKATSFMFYRVLDKLADIRIPKDTGDFRLMDKKVVESLRTFKERNRFVRGLVSYVGFKQIGVLFDRDDRFAGETKYSVTKLIGLAIDSITSFSTVPLKLITQLGFLFSGFSFLGIVYALFEKFFNPNTTVSGWTFIIVSVLFIGGVQMIMTGILGTYIGRIYSEVQKRPLYIISSVYS